MMICGLTSSFFSTVGVPNVNGLATVVVVVVVVGGPKENPVRTAGFGLLICSARNSSCDLSKFSGRADTLTNENPSTVGVVFVKPNAVLVVDPNVLKLG